ATPWRLRTARRAVPTICPSQRVVRGDELPRQAEFFCQLGGQRLYGVDLGRVVAAEVEVEPLLLRDGEPLLAQLAGHERVGVGGGEMRDGAIARAAAKRHCVRRGGAALDGDDTAVKFLQLRAQL